MKNSNVMGKLPQHEEKTEMDCSLSSDFAAPIAWGVNFFKKLIAAFAFFTAGSGLPTSPVLSVNNLPTWFSCSTMNCAMSSNFLIRKCFA